MIWRTKNFLHSYNPRATMQIKLSTSPGINEQVYLLNKWLLAWDHK